MGSLEIYRPIGVKEAHLAYIQEEEERYLHGPKRK